MKKLLSIFLAIVLIITAMPLGAFEFKASALSEGYYTYSVSDGKATITDVSTSVRGAVTIPSTLGGYPVTSIGDDAFYHCDSLTSITIPDSVTSIGSFAFSWCINLRSITIPDSITSIGDSAFYYCTSLTSITIPNSVISIGYGAFLHCSSLTSITIGDSVTSIVSYAFSDCTSLTSVYITDIAAWCNISFYDPYSNPLYYGANLYLNGELVTDLIIPNSVTSIGFYAFYNCDSLESITIPNSVTSIGYNAFSDCTNLKTVYYRGNEEDKAKISIGSNNSDLTGATWYYNSCIGDINGTGEVGLDDVTVLSKYLAGWDIEVNEDALDVSGDGKVNLFDIVLLAQYVAGWDVTLH